VAVPALPPAPTETAGLPTPVATTDTVPPATPAVDNSGAPAGAAPTAVASADDTADGGPRRVKTLKVRPDGSVEDAPAAQASAAAADGDTAALPAAAQAPAPADAMPVPAAAAPAPAPAPQQVAAVQPAPVKPKVTKPAATQASATPAAAPAASASTKYVVQVGSKKNQTEALASFADMQQKYPSLLASYRPMVQKADLGTKGVWYRLRIGPIADKTAAAKLCSQLKAQGLPDCLVATQ
jgi:cell division protein FtsN